MCGRFALHHEGTTIKRHLDVEHIAIEFKPRYNIAPSQAISAVFQHPERGDPVLDALQWGLVPFWAKDPKIGSRMINARAETVAEKPAYRAAFKRRRCLLPVSGYYEWKKDPSGKMPHYLYMEDGRPFALAGLWEEWNSPEGELLHTCTIITTEACAAVAPVHHRMPAILTLQEQQAWLATASEEAAELQALLHPYAGDDLYYHAVSPQVNAASFDAPACIDPLPS
jgi:putative SOS response-associated peptidase YedK